MSAQSSGEAAKKEKKTIGRPFQKGQSGNPGGRPAAAREFRERCRNFMEAEGWNNLVAMATDKKDRDKFRATELIAAYAYGKPKQGIEVSDPNGGPVSFEIFLHKVVTDAIYDAAQPGTVAEQPAGYGAGAFLPPGAYERSTAAPNPADGNEPPPERDTGAGVDYAGVDYVGGDDDGDSDE